MNTKQLIPYYIFQKVFATNYYDIESLGESYEVYFKIPNFYKDFKYLRVKFSTDHNVLFEFLNKYNHSCRAKRVPIRDIFFEIKAHIIQYIKETRILSEDLLNLLLSWLFLKFTLKFFYFSGKCWFDSNDCENFGNPKEKYTFWELMTEPQNSVSKYWYIILFEIIYQRLSIWMRFLPNNCTFKINLKNEMIKNLFASFHKSTINIGTPLLITQKEIVVIRKFEYSEVKGIFFKGHKKIWLENLLNILRKYDFNDYWHSCSTFRRYNLFESKYPRYHGLVFKKQI